MEAGTVVTLKLEKGYGFIRTNSRDVFFHARDLEDGVEFNELLQERRVEFDIIGSDKGDRAVRVRAAE